MSIEQIILTLSYFGILILMISNGIIAIPSSQLIYIIAGYFAFTNDLNLALVILIGALGHSIGNYILYEISRKKGMDYSIKFIKFLFQFQDPKKEIKKFQLVFNKKSKTWLFIGKLANPSKIFIPIPAGIAKMNRFTFLIITYITSAIWASVFVLIGFYFGKSYENFGYIGAILIIIFVTFTKIETY
jgi:membrane protein DedA with SNARE-associated domain